MGEEMKTFTKNCEDCDIEMTEVVSGKKVCNDCSVVRNRIQSREHARKSMHKCKTCSKMISKVRTHCGALSKKGSCAHSALTQKQYVNNKKPQSDEKEESWYKRITGKKRDTSCDSSGLF